MKFEGSGEERRESLSLQTRAAKPTFETPTEFTKTIFELALVYGVRSAQYLANCLGLSVD